MPRYVVTFVVFHEMLHAHFGMRTDGRRRLVHCPEFRRLEAAHPDFDRARLWIDRNLMRLLAF